MSRNFSLTKKKKKENDNVSNYNKKGKFQRPLRDIIIVLCVS